MGGVTRRQLPWLLVPATVVWAWLAVRELERRNEPWTFVLTTVGPPVLMIISGFVIWRERPSNRCWWLLVAAGSAWIVGIFQHSTSADVSAVTFALTASYNLFLGWAVLAFPTGRLARRHDRILVVVLASLLAIRALSRLFLFVPSDVAGYGTSNRYLPITDDRWWRLVEDGFEWAFVATMALVLASVSERWIRSSRPGRRMLTPALVGAVLLLGAVAYQYMIGWNAEVVATDGVRIYQIVWWLEGAVAVSLCVGLLRLRRTRSAVVDLVADLGHDAPPSRLGQALRHALGDPRLRLLPWSTTHGGYVDEQGDVVDLGQIEPTRAVTCIERRGEPIAAIVHDLALLEDPGLVNAVTTTVRLTIDNEQLQAELQAQLTEVAASRARIVAAGDAERRKIERDLHDGAQQRLVAIALSLRLSEAHFDANPDPAVRAVLAKTIGELQEAIAELRDLARGIHPAVLDSGLRVALDSLVTRSALPVRLELDLDGEPPREITASAYFAVAEALTNIARYADADEVTVRAVMVDGMIHIEVVDNGVGGATANGGSGLRGITDRIASVGGSVRVHSPPGLGTRFEVDLPCASS